MTTKFLNVSDANQGIKQRGMYGFGKCRYFCQDVRLQAGRSKPWAIFSTLVLALAHFA